MGPRERCRPSTLPGHSRARRRPKALPLRETAMRIFVDAFVRFFLSPTDSISVTPGPGMNTFRVANPDCLLTSQLSRAVLGVIWPEGWLNWRFRPNGRVGLGCTIPLVDAGL